MASPTINDVSLLGPNQSLPADIQARMAKAALNQKIAEALIAQSMSSDPSVIHTGGNNPFARDVANFGSPLGKIAQSYFGKQNLSESQDAQMQLAAIGQQRAQQEHGDVSSLSMPHSQIADAANSNDPKTAAIAAALQSVSGGLPVPGATTVPGDALAAANQAYGSTTPAVQARGPMLTEAIVKGLQANAVTPESSGRLLNNVAVPSFARSLNSNNMLHLPQADPNQWEPKPVVSLKGPDQTVEVTTGASAAAGGGGAADHVTNPTTAAPKPGFKAHDDANPYDLIFDTKGKPEIAKTPYNDMLNKGAIETADKKVEQLSSSQAKIQDFNNTAPAAVSVLKLLESARTGTKASEFANEAQKVLMSLGFSKDETGKVNSAETLIKFLTTQGTAATHAVSSRPSQLEFLNLMASAGASFGTDPRTVVNVVHKYLLDGLNFSKTHEENIATNTPVLGKEVANSYAAKTDFEKDLQPLLLAAGIGSQIKFGVGANGKWRDEGLATPASNLPPAQQAASNPPPKADYPSPRSRTVDSEGNDVSVDPHAAPKVIQYKMVKGKLVPI